MTPNDKAEFAQLLLTTANQYKRLFNQSFLEIYWYCLKEYDLTAIQAAFLAHFKNTDTGRFMPQPSDILRILQGSSETQALIAWTKVNEAIRSVGGYQSVVFDDFLIHAVIQAMGGWIDLCQKTEKELSFIALEFQKRYRGYLLHRPQQYSSHLIGAFEHHNQIHQQPIPEPLLFGNQQAALMTYLEGVKPYELSQRNVMSLQQARSIHSLATQMMNHTTTENADETRSQSNPLTSKGSHHEPE